MVFGWLRDKLVPRRKVYAHLCSIGLKAQIVESDLPEENIGHAGVLSDSEESMGLIEIRESPIRWVSVLETISNKGTANENVYYKNVYIVPALSLSTGETHWLMESVRVKNIPIVGRVLDIKWKANFEDELIMRLSQDVLINQTLIRLNEDVKICSFPEYGCWAISSSKYMSGFLHWVVGRSIPSREQWNCYETIAHHLLGSSGK